MTSKIHPLTARADTPEYKALQAYIDRAEACCKDCLEVSLRPDVQLAFVHGFKLGVRHSDDAERL
jgi:hypothetical protein